MKGATVAAIGLGAAGAIVAIVAFGRKVRTMNSFFDWGRISAWPWGPLHPPLPGTLRPTTANGGFDEPRWKKDAQGRYILDAQGRRIFDHWHKALDLRAEPGEPVLAVGEGLILPIYSPGDCGVGVKLRLDDGREVVYCDLGIAEVVPGQRVRAGDLVGRVHSRGFVHVSIREPNGGPWLDPRPIIPHEVT